MTDSALKRSASAQISVENLTAPQRAALVIAALGPEAAKPIVERIGEKHLRAFAEAYAHLGAIPKKELQAVVSDFVARLGAAEGEVQAGFEGTRALLSHFKSEEDATKLLDDVNPPGGRSVWQKLEGANEKAIAAYLGAQTPQVVAVILSRLDADKASTVLSFIDPELAMKVLARLARPVTPRREALRVLEAAIERDFLAPARKTQKGSNPAQTVGSMLNNLPEDKRNAMLEFIAKESPDVYEEVKAFILTFKDIPERVPANAVSKIIREVETDVFLMAAKYGKQNAPEAVEFIFKNISQRMGQQYEEQMEALKQVTIADAEAAQAQIMTAVRRLVAAGEFALNKIESEDKKDEEVYV